MKEITLAQLKAICNAPDSAQRFIGPLNANLEKWSVNSHMRLCGFLGEVAEESASFSTCLEESSGKQYEGRKDLGNVLPGDGPRFKGRGLIQITGRNIYRDASMNIFKDHRLVDSPEILEDPEYAVISALWYWWSRGLNSVMDVPLDHKWKVTVDKKPAVFTTYQWATEKINGGQNGYETRLKYFQKALEVIPKDIFDAPAPAVAPVQKASKGDQQPPAEMPQ